MAHFTNSAYSFHSALAALMVSLASMSAHAAWQTPNTPTAALPVSNSTPALGLTATVNTAYFKITQDDVAKAVAEQLQLQAVEKKAQVSLAAGTPGILYSADHPLKLVIHSLQIDAAARRWQGQVYILVNGQTETVMPVSGTYIGMVDVPVVTRQLGRNDVIEARDISTKAFPDRQLRKDTVIDPNQLIGQSPRSMITPDRPIRQAEISAPILIKKGEPVQLTFTNPYMSLKTSGTALQDGAKGDLIRIKNDKSEKAVSGRVTGNGTVEMNTAQAVITPIAAPAAALAPAAAAPMPAVAQPLNPAPEPVPATTPFQPAQR